jgi:REP element-mobilizing transposase RayT
MKYRRKVLTDESGLSLVKVCEEISERYEIAFLEIGYESDHVHFLIQSIPSLSLSQIVCTIKSITAREMFRIHQEIKQLLWGGNLWTSGFYANTVGLYGNKEVIRKYIESQGKSDKDYQKVYSG